MYIKIGSFSSWIKFIFVSLFVAGGLAVIGWDVYKDYNKELSIQAPIPAHSKLISWVYKHSTRISHKTSTQIVNEAMKYEQGLLILSICELESQGFNPTSLSDKGAIGLGQIMYSVHKQSLHDKGIAAEARDLFDIEVNIKAVDFLLKDFLQRENYDIEKTLRLYLGGKDGAYVNRICRNFVELSLLDKKNENDTK